MSEPMESAPPAPLPRFFFRRFLAYFIDVFVAWALVAIVIALFVEDSHNSIYSSNDLDVDTRFGVAFDTKSFSPPIRVVSKTCGISGQIIAEAEAYVAPNKINDVRFCIDRVFGIPSDFYITGQVVEEGGAERQVKLNYTPGTGFRFADPIAFVVFFLVSVISLRVKGTTLGKWVMGLRLVGHQPMPVWQREIIRSLPIVLSVIVVFGLEEANAIFAGLTQQVYVLGNVAQGAGIIAILLLWLWPLIAWKGAMPYDRWFGTKVVRKDYVTPEAELPF